MATSSRPRLLLVDDEVRILNALTRALRREGYEILTADSGPKALEVLDSESVDLLVSDHKMPLMSGLELCERAAKLRPELPKILISGWSESLGGDDLEALGVRALIPKPWDDGELKRILRELLRPSG